MDRLKDAGDVLFLKLGVGYTVALGIASYLTHVTNIHLDLVNVGSLWSRNFPYKEPHNTYFRVLLAINWPIATTQLCRCCLKAAIDNM